MTERLQHVLNRLENVPRSGKGYSAKCPAHDDGTASLSVSESANGTILIKCHAGCPLEGICAAIDIRISDLFPPKHQPRRLVATYRYFSADNALQYEVLRFKPKGFAQRRPNGFGGWINDLKGIERVLYRLPELLAADSSEIVFIVEGEKDADRLAAMGFIVTTNAQGAGKWGTIKDDSALNGRTLVIVPDKDPAGQKHAFDVASRLQGRAAEVRVLELPGEGKDVSEWLGAGGDVEQLRALAATAPLFDPSTLPPEEQADEDADQKPPRVTQAMGVVALCDDIEFFHDDDVPYATFLVNEHSETAPVRSGTFRRWLAHQCFTADGKVPSSQALTDALNVLAGRGLFQGPQIKVHVRIAEHQGRTYLDLADEQRTVIEIDAGSWRVCDEPPVRFRRPKGMLPLPLPSRDGNLLGLKKVLNVADERSFVLIVAWLVCCFRPNFPIPILLFISEQGSGKSTASRILRALIDPNTAAIRCAPRDPRDLMIASSNSLMVAFDNISHVSDWLSDALCRLSTGGAFSTRTLYENDDEQLFAALRPVLLNGIEELASRSDLLDRTLRIGLASIPESERRTEHEIMAEFELMRPGLLGALLDAVSTAIRRLGQIRLKPAPRMADFATWIVAAEPALPWSEGEFMAAYADNRESAHDLALEGSPIADAVIRLAHQQGLWSGRASELLSELTALADENTRKIRGWPKQPNGLTNILRRIVPNLRQVGVEIEFADRTRKGRLITIRSTRKLIDTIVTDRHHPPEVSENAAPRDDHSSGGDDAVTIPAGTRGRRMSVGVDGDDGDDQIRPQSGSDAASSEGDSGAREVSDL